MVCLPPAKREAVMKLPTLPPACVVGQSGGKEKEGNEVGMNRERTPTMATLLMWFEVAIVGDWLKLWSRGLNLEEVVVKKNVGNSVLRVRMFLSLE
jgi:hypothetical protein